ncbi:MAG: hypothetical protein OEU32_02050 [Acidimicrobiia bacterium]|nr:hypothetical protein [Acidimicrobiia bacterium]
MADRSVGGYRASSAERSRIPGAHGRVCLESGCGTRLSIYNELDYCAVHQPMVFPRMRGVILDD